MSQHENVIVEKVDNENASFGSSKTVFKIVIYDKISKVKITEYGTFDTWEEVEIFAKAHGIKL